MIINFQLFNGVLEIETIEAKSTQVNAAHWVEKYFVGVRLLGELLEVVG